MNSDTMQSDSLQRNGNSVAPDPLHDPDAAVYRKVTLRLLPLLVVCYIVAYLDRVNVSFAKLQMVTDLGFSDLVYGTGAGLFFIGYFFFEVPSNIILHRVGARVWIARIMITWGLISGCMMFVTDVTGFYLLRFALGLAEAGFFPGIILYLTYWYPAQRRGRIVSLFMLGIPLAGLLGGPFSGWIMRSFDQLMGWHGWQWMFLIEAIPSILMGLVVLRYLDDRVADATWLEEEERTRLQENIARDEISKVHVPVLQVLKSGRVWVLSFIYFSGGMGFNAIVFWLPTIIKGMGVTDTFEVGLLSAIPWLSSFVPMIIVARRADRKRERRWHFVVPVLVGAAGLSCSVLLANNNTLAFAALTIACAGMMTALPLFWSLPTAFLVGSGAAAGIAAINSLGNLAGFVSPFVIGWLKQTTHSMDIGMYLMTGILVIGALVTLSIPAKLVNR